MLLKTLLHCEQSLVMCLTKLIQSGTSSHADISSKNKTSLMPFARELSVEQECVVQLSRLLKQGDQIGQMSETSQGE